MLQLGEAIRRIRRRRGDTMVSFAQALGIGQANISRYESGKQIPSANLLLTLYTLAESQEEKSVIASALGGAPEQYINMKEAEVSRMAQDLSSYLDAVLSGEVDPQLLEKYKHSENLVQDLVRLVIRIIRSGSVSSDLVRIVDYWHQYGTDPAMWKPFEEAADYLQISLDLMAKRKLAMTPQSEQMIPKSLADSLEGQGRIRVTKALLKDDQKRNSAKPTSPERGATQSRHKR